MVIRALSRTRQQGEFMEKKILDFWLWIQLTNPPLWNIPTGTHTVCHSLSHTNIHFPSVSHRHTAASFGSVKGLFIGLWIYSVAALSLQLLGFSHLLFPLFLSSTRSFTSLFFPFHTSSFSFLHLCFSLFFCVIPSVRRCESNSSLLSFTGLKKTVCVCLTLLTRTDRRTSDMSNRRCPPPDIWCLI